MAILVIARGFQHLVAGEGRGGWRCAFLEHGAQLVATFLDLRAVAPYDVGRHQRRGGLPKGAGLHVLPETGDAAIFRVKIDGHGGATKRRALANGGVRRVQPFGQGNVGGKRENTLRVKLYQISLLAHGLSPQAVTLV